MKRPCPKDFQEVCKRIVKVRLIQKHYGAGQTTVNRWLLETGVQLRGKATHPVPDDLAKVADEKHVLGIARHYGVTPKVAARWLDKSGLKAAPCRGMANARYRPTPPDFMQNAPTMTRSGLRYHYNANPQTISRWLKETGTEPKVFVKTPPPKRSPSRGMVHAMGLSSNITAARMHTVHDIAADILRRERFPVYRCDDRGRADIVGKFWRVGNTVLDDDELLAKAERYRSKCA